MICRKIYLIFSFILILQSGITCPLKMMDDGANQGEVDIQKMKVDQLCDSCWEYRFLSPEKAMQLGEEAMKLAISIGYEKGIAQSYNDLGILFIDEANYEKAIEYFMTSLSIRKKLQDSSGIAAIYNKLGIVYQKQGRLSDALDAQLKALAIYEAAQNKAYQAVCLNNIAIIHQNLGDLERSLEYHQYALAMRVDLLDNKGEGASYLNMANVFLKLADTNSAVNYYQKALTIFQHFDDDEAYSTTLNNLGKVYLAELEYKKALPLLEKSLDLRLKMEDKKALSSSYAKLGEVYLGLKQQSLSKEMLLKSLQLAREVGVVEEEMETCSLLSLLFSKMNRYDSAYYYHVIYQELRDSVYQDRLDQQIVEVQSRYDVQRQKSENQLLVRENELFEAQLSQRKTEILLLIFIIISITGAGIFFYYRYRQRQQEIHTKELLKQNEIRMQAVIDAQESERRRIARDLHDGVGQKLSGIRLQWESSKIPQASMEHQDKLTSMKRLLDESVEEVRSISHQMMPKELEQFGLVPAIDQTLINSLGMSSIQYKFEHHGMESRVSQQIELALFRILQELVSNIIKHAGASMVTIQLLKNKRNLVLVVADNGVGMDLKSPKISGIGMMNVESRVDSIKGHIHIETAKNNGMTTTIRIPII